MTLLFLNLKALLKKMGMFFYLISIVMIFTTIGLQYIFSFAKSYIDYKNYKTEVVRSYVFENSKSVEDKLDDFIDLNNNDVRRIYALIINKDGKTLAVYYGESAAKFKAIYGKYPSKTNEINVPEKDSNNRYYTIGEDYKLFGKTYRITGISFNNTYEILYDPSLKENNLITSWVIVTDKILAGEKQDAFVNKISTFFNTVNIERPNTEQVESGNSIIFLIITLLSVLGTVNITFIYYCLLNRRKKQQAVFNILGCSKLKLSFVYLVEMLLIATVLYLFCSLFTNFILFDIMNRYSSTFYLSLEIKDYFTLFIIMVLMIISVLIWQTVLYFKKTPYELKRK